jgi:hypothetical protein
MMEAKTEISQLKEDVEFLKFQTKLLQNTVLKILSTEDDGIVGGLNNKIEGILTWFSMQLDGQDVGKHQA